MAATIAAAILRKAVAPVVMVAGSIMSEGDPEAVETIVVVVVVGTDIE